MFYGNGTARLVRNSDWRDQGAGVLDDLGSHVLDTARFWFGDIGEDVLDRFGRLLREPQRPITSCSRPPARRPQLEFEMTLLSWRNHFTCDVFAENGSAHISSLCKWGPSDSPTARACCRAAVRPSNR